MHSALIVIDKPDPFDAAHEATWGAVGAQLAYIAGRRSDSVEVLGQWCFLVRLANDGLLALAEILTAAQTVSRRVLFFDDKPAWVKGEPPA